MTIRLTREQLYELVWSEALVRLGKGLGISDVAIAKQCRKASIPIPERGYWNKLQARHAVVRTPLPPRDLATVDVIEMNGELKPEHRERFSGEPGIESAPEDIDVLAARFRQRLGKVTMPRDLMQGDPAIVKLLQRDEALRQKMATSSYYFDKPHKLSNKVSTASMHFGFCSRIRIMLGGLTSAALRGPQQPLQILRRRLDSLSSAIFICSTEPIALIQQWPCEQSLRLLSGDRNRPACPFSHRWIGIAQPSPRREKK